MPQCSKAATRSVSRFDDSLQSKSALLLRHGVVLPAALESEMRTLDDSAPAVSAARFWVLREEQRTLLGFASVEAAARQNPIHSTPLLKAWPFGQGPTLRCSTARRVMPSLSFMATGWHRMCSDVGLCFCAAMVLSSNSSDLTPTRALIAIELTFGPLSGTHARTHPNIMAEARNVKGRIGICRVPLLRSFLRGVRCWSFPLCCQLAKESHDV